MVCDFFKVVAVFFIYISQTKSQFLNVNREISDVKKVPGPLGCTDCTFKDSCPN